MNYAKTPLSLDSPRHGWMKITLLLAASYNLTWGVFVISFPLTPFKWAGMAPPNYPELWQCLGMIVGVYGVGYAIAAFDPMRHWPIILVGFLGKVLGPIGFLRAALTGHLPWVAGWLNVTNDLIWWIPFALILLKVNSAHRPRFSREAKLTNSSRPIPLDVLQSNPEPPRTLRPGTSKLSGPPPRRRPRFPNDLQVRKGTRPREVDRVCKNDSRLLSSRGFRLLQLTNPRSAQNLPNDL